MSLYNQIFGHNRFSTMILASVGIGSSDLKKIGRFRDAYITDDGKFAIFTRLGGGNRPHHQESIDFLRSFPGFIRDEDDGFDETYATFYYEPAPVYLDIVTRALEIQGHYNPMEQFKQMLDDMEHNRDTPLARRAYEVGKPVIAAIDAEMEAQAAGEEPKNILMLDADYPKEKL